MCISHGGFTTECFRWFVCSVAAIPDFFGLLVNEVRFRFKGNNNLDSQNKKIRKERKERLAS